MMAFHVNRYKNFELWDYITGNMYIKQADFEGHYHGGSYGLSITTNRMFYFEELQEMFPGIKTACHDPITNYWTKWEPGIAMLDKYVKDNWGNMKAYGTAVDVHRSVLPNEIVIESDYPTYEENYDASKIIGAILEHKGFTPHYYYSGNKSVHIHIFIDWSILGAMYYDDFTGEAKEIGTIIVDELSNFKKKFMEWLRMKMISCWDMKARDFDEDLIRATHLIRAELSKNKQGFKTFLGYTHKDMSFVPYVCNEKNRIYPRLAEIKLSQPYCIRELIEEFQESKKIQTKINRIKKKHKPFRKWVDIGDQTEIRKCIKAILSDDFKEAKDGSKRGMFFLVNELRAVYGDETAMTIAKDWNARMGNPVRDAEIVYRFKLKHYTMTCGRVHSFLEEVGVIPKEKCTHKL
jgi:hypothetical protein